ncbi:MAG: hypothetical protein K2L02_01730 [Clostridia bacterium]|nr:hypothetical protein [Clostridia bacterium]
MSWFNYYGLAIIVIIMIPNIVFAFKHKDGFNNTYKNKVVEVLEQIGRYACFVFMIFNIPYTYFDFWFDYALIVYLSVNGALLLAYLIFWIVFWKSNGKAKALALSLTPSLIFLFSGVVLLNIPLIVFALLFSVNHILLSYKNAVTSSETDK